MSNRANAEALTEPPAASELMGSLDHRIYELTKSNMTPLMKLEFDGSLGVADIQHIHEQLMGIEIIAPHPRSPVEYWMTSARDKLTEWQTATCDRFRADFEFAMASYSGVMNYENIGFHDTELTRKHRAAGYGGRGASRHYSRTEIADQRLAAMQRRGAFQKANHRAFWFCEAIIGFELWPKDLAPHLQIDLREVRSHFNLALMSAAGFYRLHATGPKRGKMQGWHDREVASHGAVGASVRNTGL